MRHLERHAKLIVLHAVVYGLIVVRRVFFFGFRSQSSRPPTRELRQTRSENRRNVITSVRANYRRVRHF